MILAVALDAANASIICFNKTYIYEWDFNTDEFSGNCSSSWIKSGG